MSETNRVLIETCMCWLFYRLLNWKMHGETLKLHWSLMYAAEDSHALLAHNGHINCRTVFDLFAVIGRVPEVACSRFNCRVYSDAGTAVPIFLCPNWPCGAVCLCCLRQHAVSCFLSDGLTMYEYYFNSAFKTYWRVTKLNRRMLQKFFFWGGGGVAELDCLVLLAYK